jgi:transketolase
LNQLSARWLLRTLAGVSYVFSLDNHHVVGGQGDRIAEVLAAAPPAKWPRLQRFAVEGLPACGSQSDVLRRHQLDSWSLRQRALDALQAPRLQSPAFLKSFEADTGL